MFKFKFTGRKGLNFIFIASIYKKKVVWIKLESEKYDMITIPLAFLLKRRVRCCVMCVTLFVLNYSHTFLFRTRPYIF